MLWFGVIFICCYYMLWCLVIARSCYILWCVVIVICCYMLWCVVIAFCCYMSLWVVIDICCYMLWCVVIAICIHMLLYVVMCRYSFMSLYVVMCCFMLSYAGKNVGMWITQCCFFRDGISTIDNMNKHNILSPTQWIWPQCKSQAKLGNHVRLCKVPIIIVQIVVVFWLPVLKVMERCTRQEWFPLGPVSWYTLARWHNLPAGTT